MYLVTTNSSAGAKSDLETRSDKNLEKTDENSDLINQKTEEMSVKNRKNNKKVSEENISGGNPKTSANEKCPNSENYSTKNSTFKNFLYQVCDTFDLKFFVNKNVCRPNNIRNFKKAHHSETKNQPIKKNNLVNEKNHSITSETTPLEKSDVTPPQKINETLPKKSLLWAYVWWLFGGIFGLHLFYLERDAHAFLTWSTFGGYGVGWLADIIRIPRYVREYNEDPRYLQDLYERIRKNRKPPFSTSRFISAIMIGYLWGQMVMLAIPTDDIRGINFNTYLHWFIPLAAGLGIWTVGNIGKEQGKPWLTILVCYLTYTTRWYFFDESIWLSVMVFSGALAFDGFSKEWRFMKQKKKGVFKRMVVVGFCIVIYLGVWSSYLYFNGKVTDSNGDEIPLHEALHHFFTSPWWTDLKQSLYEVYQYAQHHGWYEIWKQIIDLSDPHGEQNAYRVLDVSPTASQTEITARWRKLSREFHPDKVKDPALQRAAQEKFMEIQQAYEILSNIKNKRRRKNKKSVDRDDEHEL